MPVHEGRPVSVSSVRTWMAERAGARDVFVFLGEKEEEGDIFRLLSDIAARSKAGATPVTSPKLSRVEARARVVLGLRVLDPSGGKLAVAAVEEAVTCNEIRPSSQPPPGASS